MQSKNPPLPFYTPLTAEPPVSGCASLARVRKACRAALLLAVTSKPITSYALRCLVASPSAAAADATTLFTPPPPMLVPSPTPPPLPPLLPPVPSSRRGWCRRRRRRRDCEGAKVDGPTVVTHTDDDDVTPRPTPLACVTTRPRGEGAAAMADMSSSRLVCSEGVSRVRDVCVNVTRASLCETLCVRPVALPPPLSFYPLFFFFPRRPKTLSLILRCRFINIHTWQPGVDFPIGTILSCPHKQYKAHNTPHSRVRKGLQRTNPATQRGTRHGRVK